MRDNDQNRWEYEVQQYQEREEMKKQVMAFCVWAFLWLFLLAVLFSILSA